ncbi:hypothetical protein AAG906_018939 [Vitis piasezkii]
MPKTRGGSTTASQSSQRAAPAYHTRRASATSGALSQVPPRSPPTKRAKTSEPGDSSRAPRDSQSPPSSIRRRRPSLPIEGNSDCRSRDFHVEAYFDHSLMRQQPELQDSYRLLERYHLIPFMTRPVLLSSSSFRLLPSMTTRGVPPTSILLPLMDALRYFGARQIAEAFHIPLRLHSFTFPLLLCHVLAHMGFPLLEPAAIVERASLLTNGLRYGSIASPQNFPSQGKSLLLRPLQILHSQYQVPEAASSDAPPVVPPTSEPPITIPGPERPLWSAWTTSRLSRTSRLSFSVRFKDTSVLCHQLHQ